MGKNVRCVIFFLLFFIYLSFIALLYLPSVHYYLDAVAIRDTGTLWNSLTLNISDKRYFLPAAILLHPEGPLQFLFLNAYYLVVGDFFPLKPSTTQVPNVVLSLLSGVVAFLFGKKIYSEKFGYLCAVSFMLMPWLGRAIRLPWVFNTMSGLLELATLYYYTGFILNPENRFYRVSAPISLALYLCTGLDWPSFLFILLVFLTVNRRFLIAVKNIYNVFPLTVLVLVYILWTIGLYYYGKDDPTRATLYWHSLLLYPFSKIAFDATLPSVHTLVKFGFDAFGITMFLAILGAAWFFLSERMPRTRDFRDIVRRRCFVCMALWMVIFSIALFKHSGSITYAYVLSVPVALLSAVFLLRVKVTLVVVAALVMIGIQVYGGLGRSWITYVSNGDDRRVQAAAAFLIQDRPGLLGQEKKAFLPRNEASNVGQYARGQNKRIVMPENFPTEGFLHSVGSDAGTLLDFVESYNMRREIKADWLILSSENISSRTRSSAFYRRLLFDEKVQWFASFKDEHERVLWLGEVIRDGSEKGTVAAGNARVYPVGPLADLYGRKYDRMSFLRRNVRYVDHY